ncbi:MAG TPA: carbonic anhydrase [Agriterribacter sp.]|nr:carbonic anhydrase [Chitinophagaceae bacterium]HRP33861.1 carbonic anhydrase [Agriterribacter sp.]
MALSYEEIFKKNREWIAKKLGEEPDYFKNLSKGQLPSYLFIGCSDSRADPEEITGLNLGDIFVHRNISNIVNPIDLSATSVIQYGIENLNIRHIIVCGHYGCGGVSAAMKKEGLGKNSPWLQIIKDIHRIHKSELDLLESDEMRYDRLVELNVIEQCQNVLEMDVVKNQYYSKRYPSVHGWVFDIRTGKIIDLNFDYKKGFNELRGERPNFGQRLFGLLKKLKK